MRIEQRRWHRDTGWAEFPATNELGGLNGSTNIVMVFGDTAALETPSLLPQLRSWYPHAAIAGCSTAGEILGATVSDGSLAVTAIQLERTALRCARTDCAGVADSFAAGQRLADNLRAEDLTHVLVLSDGLSVNGSELVRGLSERLPEVGITGGLSGDGARFARTLTLLDGLVAEQRIAALGFYGKHLRVGYGSCGGWDAFGPERRVTRSRGNVLYELDGGNALELYRKYLGDHAAGLPASGLLFPLSVRIGKAEGVVRTILGVNDGEKSMTFAGDVPQGSYARLMKANMDRLIAGAAQAGATSRTSGSATSPELAILISCVGRKLVLKQRTEEEVEAVQRVLGPATAMTGFYSYGEICPFGPEGRSELHNQTMTVTTFSEN